MSWLQKTAMFIFGEGDYVVAYKSNIFLVDPEQDIGDPIIRNMANFLGVEIEHSHVYDYLSHLRDVRPDILLGHRNGRTLSLQSEEFQHGEGSRLLQNVVKTLGLDNVDYQNEHEVYRDLSQWQVTSNLPEFLYHGTSSYSAERILRFGLQAGESTTNYLGRGQHNDITHDDIVFLAEDINKAVGHAGTAASNQKGFPVVFRFKVPDPSLLLPDYDIETMYNDYEFEGNVYNNTYKAPASDWSARIKEEPFGFSKKVGVFGYRGRIPASFIVDIMIHIEEGDSYEYSGDEWVSITAAQLLTALELGDPMAYAYEPEEEEEDEYEDTYSSNNWMIRLAGPEEFNGSQERPLFAAIRVNGEHFTGSGLDEHWEAIEKALQAGVLKQNGRGKLIYNPPEDDLDLYLTNYERIITKLEADQLAAK